MLNVCSISLLVFFTLFEYSLPLPTTSHHTYQLEKIKPELSSNCSISVQNERLYAERFPFEIKYGIKLKYDDINDGMFNLPRLIIQVYNGSLFHSNPFPGLHLENKNASCIIATGSIDDLQLWITSGRNSSDYTEKADEFVEPGGGIRYNPPMYDWIGTAAIHLTLVTPNIQSEDDMPNKLSSSDLAIIEMDIHPYLQMRVSIDKSINYAETLEDESCFPFLQGPTHRGVKIAFEGIQRKRVISCILQASNGSFDQSIVNGTIATMNSLLTRIKYAPKGNFNGLETVIVSCHNYPENQFDQTSFGINVIPINDRPTIMIHPERVFETWEDTKITLGPYAALFIVDADVYESENALIAIALEVTMGKASLNMPSSELLGRLHVSSNSTSQLQLLGHIDELNIALQYVSMTFEKDWFGRGTLTVHCTDEIVLGNETMEIFYQNWLFDYVDFVVKNINDNPIIRTKSSLFKDINEGDTIRFDKGQLEVWDVDSGPFDTLHLTIEISAVGGVIPGRLAFPDEINEKVKSFNINQNHDKSILYDVHGTLRELSYVLQSMQLLLMSDWFGICNKCFNVSVRDKDQGTSEQHFIFIVHPLDDAPSIALSNTSITSHEDEEIVFSRVLNITLSDVDNLFANQEEGMFEVIIQSISNATIGFKDYVPGCHIKEGSPYIDPGPRLAFLAPMSILNQAIKVMYYIPPPNLDSYDILRFRIVDEQLLHGSSELYIDFSGINDAPSITSKSVAKSVDANKIQMIKTGFLISDADGPREILTVTLSLYPADAGELKLNENFDAGVHVELLQKDVITFIGTLPNVNKISDEIIVLFNEDYSTGTLILSASVQDREGMIDKTSMELHVDMNQKVPYLDLLYSSTTSKEDHPLLVGSLISVHGTFDESTVFELNFRCIHIVEEIQSLLFGVQFKFADLSLPGIHIPIYDINNGSYGKILLRGNVKELNNALAKLNLIPPDDYVGDFILTISIKAWSNSLYDDISSSKEIHITIERVDDRPEIFWDGVEFLSDDPILDTNEDSFKPFGKRLDIVDKDHDNEHIILEIITASGSICSHWSESNIMNNAEFSFYHTNEEKIYNCTNEIWLSKYTAIEKLNQVLHSIAYKPAPNWNGVDKLEMKIVSNKLIVSKSIRIAVRPEPDEPHIILPTTDTLVVEEDGTLLVDKIYIQDNDSAPPEGSLQSNICNEHPEQCYATVELKVSYGLVDAERIGSVFMYQKDEPKRIIFMRGSLHDINKVLSGVVYKPDNNYIGFDNLTITAINNNASSSKKIQIQVKGTNDAPRLMIPQSDSSVLDLWEDQEAIIGDDYCFESEFSSYITCESIQIYDDDIANEHQNSTMLLKFISRYGMFRIPRLRLAGKRIYTEFNISVAEFTNNITLQGPMETLNWILTGIVFKGRPNHYSTENIDELSIYVEDDAGGVAMETLFLRILPVNDSPVIVVKDETVDENTLTDDGLSHKRIHSATLNMSEDSSMHVKGISVRDVDCTKPSDLVEVVLSSSNGTLLLSDHVVMRQWIEGYEGKYFGRITIRGTIKEMNEALKYLSYKPKPNYHGRDIIKVHISDMGNVGVDTDTGTALKRSESVELHDIAEIPISVSPVADLPIIISPSYFKMKEDSFEVLDFHFSHPDSEDETVIITIQSANAKIRFNAVDGLAFLNGTFNDSPRISVKCKMFDLQRPHRQIIFTPNEHWNNQGTKADFILLSVCNDTPQQIHNICARKTIHVDIVGINDAPQWHVPDMELKLQPTGGYVVNSVKTIDLLEDESTTVSPISLSDVDNLKYAQDNIISVSITVAHGTFELAKFSGLIIESFDETKFEFTNTLSTINEALQYLIYTPHTDYNGQDMIMFSAIDGEFNVSINIPINIIPVPDEPFVAAPSIQSCNEEIWCAISDVTVDDIDKHNELILEVSTNKGSLAFAGGLVKPLRAISMLDGTRHGGTYFRLSGTAVNLSSLLDKLAYLPTLGSAGTRAIIKFVVHTQLQESISKIHNSETVFQMVIGISNSQNNRPFFRYNKAIYYDDPKCLSSYRSTNLTEGASLHALCSSLAGGLPPFECFEGLNCNLSGITIQDPDSETLRLIMCVNEGTLSLNSSTRTVLNITGNQNCLFLRGHQDDINHALNSLIYKARANFVGKSYIKLEISDPHYGEEVTPFYEMEIEIIVMSVVDQIEIAGPAYTTHFQDEDEISLIPSIVISHRHNVPSGDFVVVRADFDVSGGKIYLQNTKGINFTSYDTFKESNQEWSDDIAKNRIILMDHEIEGVTSGSKSSDIGEQTISGMQPRWWRKVSMYGLLNSVNNALEHITFTGEPNMNSDDDGLSKIKVGIKRIFDSHKEATILRFNNTVSYHYDDRLSMLINVQPINDAPTIVAGQNTVDGIIQINSISIDEDEQVNIPVYINDVDDDVIQIELNACQSGHLSILNEAPGENNDIYFLVGSVDEFSRKIVMRGTIDSLNGHLSTLRFKGEKNFNDDCILKMQVCDDHGSCNVQHITIRNISIEDPIYMYLPVDSSFSHPTIVLDEGRAILLGSQWIRSEDFMMMRVTQNEGTSVDTKEVDIHPLITGHLFLLSDGNTPQHDDDKREACIEISVDKGSISLQTSSSNTSTLVGNIEDNYKTKRIRVRSSIGAINEDISTNLIYHSIHGEIEEAKLHIIVSREMICHKENSKSNEECDCNFDVYDAKDYMNIFITPVNSPPVIQWHGKNIIQTNVDEKISLSGIVIIDSDMDESRFIDARGRIFKGFLTVSLAVTVGTISFDKMYGITATIGDGIDDSTMEIMGSVENVNKSLNFLRYECNNTGNQTKACLSGMVVTFRIVVGDNNFSGKSGAKMENFEMNIVISAES